MTRDCEVKELFGILDKKAVENGGEERYKWFYQCFEFINQMG